MSSTSFNVGIAGDNKISSRVLKPPGGGHTDIFAPPEETVRQPRPKNNQQNSAMMGEIMGKSDAPAAGRPANNGVKDSVRFDNDESSAKVEACPVKAAPVVESSRARVPPGGFSTGLW